ncbi:MAG: hypothetical protein CVU38_18320 [Chloroflexi bacterium HGW-Chloroflexi-1]|nr:MAG: hypothetical protein CVU38_18320 [Chloroflexi bacterium HGW-Chloroflexi-1]
MAGICLNEDDSHFYVTRTAEEMDEEHVDALVDTYAGTQVRELLFCPNAMRTSYASAVWPAIWDGYDPEAGDDQPFLQSAGSEMRRWPHNAWLLNHQGIDPYQRWLARSRTLNISPWLSMRMNDVHCVDNLNSPLVTEFWRKHQEYWRVPWRFDSWQHRAFDYGRKEVRDHHMLLVRELVERYDMDGLELDWMRFGYHFRPGREEQGRGILTEFTSQVRELLDRREAELGHPIKLGCRVPSRPQTARALGMDAVEWARRGLVDMIVVTPFWATIEFDMPIELWKELLGETDVILAAGLEVLLRPFPQPAPARYCDVEAVRGAAASLLARGADRIYLFNYMDNPMNNPMASQPDENGTYLTKGQYERVLNETGSLETLAGKPRRHVVTYSDTWAPGEPEAASLPTRCEKGKTAEFRLHIGPKPQSGKSTVLIGTKEGKSDIEVHVNSSLCPRVEAHPDDGARSPAEILHECDVPLKELNPGYNVIEATSRTADAEIVWVELFIHER